MARFTIAALTGAMLLASPVLANEPVRPAAATFANLHQAAELQAGARTGVLTTRKHSNLAAASTGYILAGLVAVGAGVGIATANGNGHSSSP
jgi:hypothetical protein